MVGAMMFVMPSLDDVPESEDGGRTATGGAAGGVVSTTMASVPPKPEELPAASVAFAFSTWVAWVKAVGIVKVQLPTAFAVVVPTTTLPS